MQMRLLNVYTLEFSEHSRDIPKYAIASHRWKAGNEATIKDIRKKKNTNKDGYRKIEGFAKYVRENIGHVDWLWIDTCCVNQDSSQEVTEAVNSMFRWYANAELCLAYLADVDNALEEGELRRSEWFRRGWTLQELLAPHVLVFLSRNWKTIGHKGGGGWTKSGFRVSEGPGLEITVAAITGIPEGVLHNYHQSKSLSFKERLSWIAGRETTHGEDMSYSLFGMFNVTMPVIYGEGFETARKRLLEELSKTSISTCSEPGIQTMLTNSSQLYPIPCAVVPFRRDPDYVAREETIQQVRQKLSSSEARVALVGLGGVGKSLLALEFAHQVREREPKTWVLWLHASNAARFQQSVQNVVDQLQIPGGGDPKVNVFRLFETWLREQRNDRWLLILDNADDARFLRQPPPSGNVMDENGLSGGTGQSCLEYLPVCDYGSILFTTRSRHAATQLVHERAIVNVPRMDEQHAKTLFKKKLRQQYDEGDIAELVQALEYLPLAIAQACAYIKERAPRCSVRQYLESLRKSENSKMSLLKRDEGNLYRDKEASNSILLTWQISFEHIRQIRPSAADLLSLMSFFDRQAIPEFLIKEQAALQCAERTTEGSSNFTTDNYSQSSNDYSEEEDSASNTSFDHDFEDDVTILRGYSFIALTTDEATFEMHDLVQLATQRWLKTQEQLEPWKRQFIVALNAALPDGEYENWTLCQTIFPHAQSARKLRFEEPNSLLQYSAVMYRAAWYALRRGIALDAEEMALLSMRARLKQLGRDHHDTLLSIAMVASSRKDQGRWREAEELFVQVMDTRKRVLGEEHPDTLSSIANLASTFWNQGRWKEAEELEVQVMETSKKVLGEEHPDTLSSIANLASTFWNQGRWKEAEELEVQVMETSKKVLGEEHPNTLSSIANLASTFWNQGRWKEAEELFVQVMDTRKRVLGEEHPDTLSSIANLASTYRNQGRWKEAEELFVQVIDTRKRVLGEEHPDTLTSIANLASTYRNQGRWKEAEELFVQVIDTRKRVLGEEHPDTLTSIANLASTYRNQGRWKEAEELFVQVIETRKRVLGEEHPDTLTSMANLVHTLKAKGDDDAALESISACAALSAEVLGPDHPYTD